MVVLRGGPGNGVSAQTVKDVGVEALPVRHESVSLSGL